MSSVATQQSEAHPDLEALYVLNKAAKSLAQRAASSRSGSTLSPQNTSRALTAQKNALYEVKQRVLENLYPSSTRIELHDIQGEEYYCFYFGTWSFHTPVREFSKSVEVDGHLALPDFESSHTITRTALSLGDAIAHLNRTHGINANDFLDQRHILAPDGTFVDIGWPLSDSVEAR